MKIRAEVSNNENQKSQKKKSMEQQKKFFEKNQYEQKNKHNLPIVGMKNGTLSCILQTS